jgi:hypothetical protein
MKSHPRVHKFTEHDKEDNKRRDPAPEFVCVHNLVPEQRNKKRAERDDQNSTVPGEVMVDSVQKGCADDRVHA